jgi:hypothetical protein
LVQIGERPTKVLSADGRQARKGIDRRDKIAIKMSVYT